MLVYLRLAGLSHRELEVVAACAFGSRCQGGRHELARTKTPQSAFLHRTLQGTLEVELASGSAKAVSVPASRNMAGCMPAAVPSVARAGFIHEPPSVWSVNLDVMSATAVLVALVSALVWWPKVLTAGSQCVPIPQWASRRARGIPRQDDHRAVRTYRQYAADQYLRMCVEARRTCCRYSGGASSDRPRRLARESAIKTAPGGSVGCELPNAFLAIGLPTPVPRERDITVALPSASRHRCFVYG
jgi:hypothetical protein